MLNSLFSLTQLQDIFVLWDMHFKQQDWEAHLVQPALGRLEMINKESQWAFIKALLHKEAKNQLTQLSDQPGMGLALW